MVDLSLQACSNVTLEDNVVLGECCPPGHDSSLNLFVLVFVSGAVSLSQVDVAFNDLLLFINAGGVETFLMGLGYLEV